MTRRHAYYRLLTAACVAWLVACVTGREDGGGGGGGLASNSGQGGY